MTDTVAQALISQARKEIRSLKCPRGTRRDAWKTVIDLLLAIAGYLPDAWPSERTLAKKLGRRQPHVHRTLVRAREWGLVSTTVRPLAGSTRDGQTYHLLCLSEGLRAAIARYQFQIPLGIRSEYSYSVGVQHGPHSVGASRPREEGSNVVPLNRWSESDDWGTGPAIGEDPEPELPVLTPKPVDPAVALWARFTDKWARLQRRQPGLKIIRRGPSGRGIGYLRRWIENEGYSPEHIEAYMDEFIEAVAAGEVVIKERQFAWQCLTAWWGTTDVEDPAVGAAAKASAARSVAAAREYWAAQDRLTNG
jgi:hypothetical protein